MMLKLQLNLKHTVSMQSANGTVDHLLGIIENLAFCFRTIELQLQVHVIEDPAYDILLGRPFDVLTESSIKNYRNEDQTITITDPNDPSGVTTMQTHPRTKVPRGFLGIDDLRVDPQGDTLDSFNVTMHRVSDLDAARDDLSKFDMMSIPGFALSIDAALSTPTTQSDFFTYMISISGSIVPFISRLFFAESTNDYPISTYYHALPALSAQLPEKECTLTHSLVHIRPDGTFLETLSTPLPMHSTPSSDTDASMRVFKYKPIAKKSSQCLRCSPKNSIPHARSSEIHL